MGTASPKPVGNAPNDEPDKQGLSGNENRLVSAFQPAAEGTEDAVKAVHKKAREQFEEDRKAVQSEQLTGESSRAGTILSNTAAAASDSKAEAKDKKRRADQDTLMRLIALQQRIDQLNREIDHLREQLGEVMDDLEKLEDLEDLLQSGKFDPTNPAHAAMAEELGLEPNNLTPDDIDRLRAELNGEADRLQNEIDNKEEELEHAQEEYDQTVEAYTRAEGPEEAERLKQEVKERMREATNTTLEINDIRENNETISLSDKTKETAEIADAVLTKIGNLDF